MFNLTIRPLADTDRAAWQSLWTGYLTFYKSTLPPDLQQWLKRLRSPVT